MLGNPNCGKTTLFNSLTGTYQKVGNWAGVTTEKKIGRYKKDKKVEIIDLPGIYSLSANSDDERAVLDYLKGNKNLSVINIVDGTNLERNLYLTCRLAELNLPVTIAVNYSDDLKINGISFNAEALSKTFGVPVVMISALKGENIDKLVITAKNNDKKIHLNGLKDYKGDNYSAKIYKFIEENIKNIVIKTPTKAEKFTLKADKILTHKIWGIPIFVCIITLVYFLSLKIGGLGTQTIESVVSLLEDAIYNGLISLNLRSWAIELSLAIVRGLGAVLSFLPQILVLFLFLTIIEQSGYSARISFILDNIFRKIGLGGKSVIPLTLGCGCAVTAIMATRTIESESEKRMAIFLAPIMPCGAKMAVFGWFSYKLFGGSALIATSTYLISIISVALFGSILKNFKCFQMKNQTFLLEIPPLRVPSMKDILCVLFQKCKDFISKAGTVILGISVLVWFLQNFGIKGYLGDLIAQNPQNIEHSFLYLIGNALKFIFYPLGFGNPEATVSIFAGFMAKEAVIETLTILTNDVSTLFLTPFSAYAFMVFVLLSPPCMASIISAKRELKSAKWLAFMLVFQSLSAYFVAFFINTFGLIILSKNGLIYSTIVGIIGIVTVLVCIIKCFKAGKCGNCTACKKGRICRKRENLNTTI